MMVRHQVRERERERGSLGVGGCGGHGTGLGGAGGSGRRAVREQPPRTEREELAELEREILPAAAAQACAGWDGPSGGAAGGVFPG